MLPSDYSWSSRAMKAGSIQKLDAHCISGFATWAALDLKLSEKPNIMLWPELWCFSLKAIFKCFESFKQQSYFCIKWRARLMGLTNRHANISHLFPFSPFPFYPPAFTQTCSRGCFIQIRFILPTLAILNPLSVHPLPFLSSFLFQQYVIQTPWAVENLYSVVPCSLVLHWEFRCCLPQCPPLPLNLWSSSFQLHWPVHSYNRVSRTLVVGL